MTFEQARDELEQVVRRLEDGATTLDDAIALWERGEELYGICRARLDTAEARIERLAESLREAAASGDEAAGEEPVGGG